MNKKAYFKIYKIMKKMKKIQMNQELNFSLEFLNLWGYKKE